MQRTMKWLNDIHVSQTISFIRIQPLFQIFEFRKVVEQHSPNKVEDP